MGTTALAYEPSGTMIAEKDAGEGDCERTEGNPKRNPYSSERRSVAPPPSVEPPAELRSGIQPQNVESEARSADGNRRRRDEIARGNADSAVAAVSRVANSEAAPPAHRPCGTN